MSRPLLAAFSPCVYQVPCYQEGPHIGDVGSRRPVLLLRVDSSAPLALCHRAYSLRRSASSLVGTRHGRDHRNKSKQHAKMQSGVPRIRFETTSVC